MSRFGPADIAHIRQQALVGLACGVECNMAKRGKGDEEGRNRRVRRLTYQL